MLGFMISFLVLSSCLPLPGSWVYLMPILGENVINSSTPEIVVINNTLIRHPMTLSIVIEPNNNPQTLQPIIKVVDVSTTTPRLIHSIEARQVGEKLVMQNFLMIPGIIYTVTVEGMNGTIGSFNRTTSLDSSLETEEITGIENDNAATGEPIDSSFLSVLSRGSRGAVNGMLEDGSDVDRYTLTLEKGESIELAVEIPNSPLDALPVTAQPLSLSASDFVFDDLTGIQPQNFTGSLGSIQLTALVSSILNVQLLDGTGTPLNENTESAFNVDGLYRLTVPQTGTYQIMVSAHDPSSTSSINYQLLVLRNAEFERERNDRLATPQMLTFGLPMLGYVGYDLPVLRYDPKPPAHVAGNPFNLGFNASGELIFLDAEDPSKSVGVQYNSVEYLSFEDPHRLWLRSSTGEKYELQETDLMVRQVGNLRILQVTGYFNLTPDETPELVVELLREFSFYITDSYMFVHTTLINPNDIDLTGYSLVERYNPAPDKTELTVNNLALPNELFVFSTNGRAFGIGSPDDNILLAFEPGVGVGGSPADEAMLITQPVLNLPTGDSQSFGYNLLFGENLMSVQAIYTAAVAQGFSLDDYYRVNLQGNTWYAFDSYLSNATITSNTPVISPSLEIIDSGGTVVANLDGDTYLGDHWLFNAPAEGTYTVRVFAPPDYMQVTGSDYVIMVYEIKQNNHVPVIYR